MEYRFEANEVGRVVRSNFNQPDEMRKLVNLFDAVTIQWHDLIQADHLDQEQSAVLDMIKERLELFDAVA